MVKLNKQLPEAVQELHDKCWAIDPDKMTKDEMKDLMMAVSATMLKLVKKLKQRQEPVKPRPRIIV